MIPLLAHGALGWFDEIVFVSVVVIFFVMSGVSWFRSRQMEPEFDDEATDENDEALKEALFGQSEERFELE